MKQHPHELKALLDDQHDAERRALDVEQGLSQLFAALNADADPLTTPERAAVPWRYWIAAVATSVTLTVLTVMLLTSSPTAPSPSPSDAAPQPHATGVDMSAQRETPSDRPDVVEPPPLDRDALLRTSRHASRWLQASALNIARRSDSWIPSPSKIMPPRVRRKTRERPPVPSPTPARSVSWQEHYYAGHFDAAFRAAQDQGWDPLVQHLNAADLLLLAEVARLAGERNVARETLVAVRGRFPRADQASEAAYRLGLLSHEPIWFERYLSEAPKGTLRMEAMGRLLLLYRERKHARTNALAREYLAEFPDGIHANIAGRILTPDP